MNKNELRKKYKELRKEISNKEEQSINIFNQLKELDKIKECSTILVYLNNDDEVITKYIIDYFSNKKIIGVPKVNKNEMNFYKISDDTIFIKGPYNIYEPISNELIIPDENTVVIVPGIVFDENDYRIGYGKGYYDKYLSKYKVYTIGITFEECLINDVFHEKHDIKLDKVIANKKC